MLKALDNLTNPYYEQYETEEEFEAAVKYYEQQRRVIITRYKVEKKVRDRAMMEDRFKESREAARAAIRGVDPEVRRVKMQTITRLTEQYPREIAQLHINLP